MIGTYWPLAPQEGGAGDPRREIGERRTYSGDFSGSWKAGRRERQTRYEGIETDLAPLTPVYFAEGTTDPIRGD